MDMPTGPVLMDFKPHSLPLLVSILPVRCGGRQTERKRPVLVLGGVGWHMDRTREQSSIGYISSRTVLPLRAAFLILSAPIICRSHRAQTGRARAWECECVGGREKEQKVTPSLAFLHTNSLFLCLLAGDGVIRLGGKTVNCLPLRGSDCSVLQTEHAQNPKSCRVFEFWKEGREENRGEQQWKETKKI